MTPISDERLAEMIIAAYRRGHAWCLENPGSEEYLAKAAYDYADKALSSLEASPAPVSEGMVEGVCAHPNCTCAQMCDDLKFPTLEEAHAAAVSAAKVFCDAADVEETNWTGWGEQTVPASATMRRVKAYQALSALRDAKPAALAAKGGQ